MWPQALLSNFKKSSDQLLSAKQYVSECTKRFPPCFQVITFGLGIFNERSANTVLRCRVEEVFCNSTFKTNKNQMELFCVMASCFGKEFLLAGFTLKLGTSKAYLTREEFFLQTSWANCKRKFLSTPTLPYSRTRWIAKLVRYRVLFMYIRGFVSDTYREI